MTPREAWLPVLDTMRAALNTAWDLRRYDIAIVVNTWSGSVISQGTKTQVTTPLVVNDSARPKVEQLSQRDILASGGLYQDQDLRIGPFTPYSAAYPTGIDPSAFDVPVVGPNVEVLFQVTGPGMPTGALYKKVGQDVSRNFRLSFILRKTGEVGA